MRPVRFVKINWLFLNGGGPSEMGGELTRPPPLWAL